jgi:hypothetical protein
MRSASANRVLICVSNCCLSFGSVALLSCERVSSRSSCISAKSRSAMESVRVLQSRPPIPYSVSCRQLVRGRWLVARGYWKHHDREMARIGSKVPDGCACRSVKMDSTDLAGPRGRLSNFSAQRARRADCGHLLVGVLLMARGAPARSQCRCRAGAECRQDCSRCCWNCQTMPDVRFRRRTTARSSRHNRCRCAHHGSSTFQR